MWDTVVALAIGGFVAVPAVLLGRQVLAVLGQHAPAGMDVEVVAGDLCRINGVQGVQDLHLWTLTSGTHVATAHLVTATRPPFSPCSTKPMPCCETGTASRTRPCR